MMQYYPQPWNNWNDIYPGNSNAFSYRLPSVVLSGGDLAFLCLATYLIYRASIWLTEQVSSVYYPFKQWVCNVSDDLHQLTHQTASIADGVHMGAQTLSQINGAVNSFSYRDRNSSTESSSQSLMSLCWYYLGMISPALCDIGLKWWNSASNGCSVTGGARNSGNLDSAFYSWPGTEQKSNCVGSGSGSTSRSNTGCAQSSAEVKPTGDVLSGLMSSLSNKAPSDMKAMFDSVFGKTDDICDECLDECLDECDCACECECVECVPEQERRPCEIKVTVQDVDIVPAVDSTKKRETRRNRRANNRKAKKGLRPKKEVKPKKVFSKKPVQTKTACRDKSLVSSYGADDLVTVKWNNVAAEAAVKPEATVKPEGTTAEPTLTDNVIDERMVEEFNKVLTDLVNKVNSRKMNPIQDYKP